MCYDVARDPVYEEFDEETPTTAMVPAQPMLGGFDTGAPNPSSSIKMVFDVTRLKCVSWTNDGVSSWLKNNGLDKYVKK